MAKQKGNGERNRSTERKDPNQDVQPWLGWVAAAMVVLIVVVAVAMGLERSNRGEDGEAEVSMTPIVGGMAVATAANESDGRDSADGATAGEPDVTSLVTVTLPITATDGVTGSATVTDGVAVTDSVTVTDGVGVTATAGLTNTAALTASTQITDGATITDAGAVTVTTDVTGEVTESGTDEASVAVTATATFEPEAAATATSQPTPTPRPSPSPTPTRSGPPPSFDVGDMVVNESDRVTLHADITRDSLVLDTVNAGVAMTVIEPSGTDLTYPVESEGFGWVRVRSADGLVGWAITDGLSRVP